jgi:biopolymer transport protein ExbB/TolQ
MDSSRSLIDALLDLPLFHAEWVLWFLLVLSLVSIAFMGERAWFYKQRRLDLHTLQKQLAQALSAKNYDAAEKALAAHDTLETNVVLFGLREHAAGPEAVEDLLFGITQKEKERYDARLAFLATVASNAPFIGLFGTVLGIIRAFKDLAGNAQNAGTAVMSGVAEALVATAVGLLVAIPALVAFNIFKRRVKLAMNNAQFLSRLLLAHLKSL